MQAFLLQFPKREYAETSTGVSFGVTVYRVLMKQHALQHDLG